MTGCRAVMVVDMYGDMAEHAGTLERASRAVPFYLCYHRRVTSSFVLELGGIDGHFCRQRTMQTPSKRRCSSTLRNRIHVGRARRYAALLDPPRTQVLSCPPRQIPLIPNMDVRIIQLPYTKVKINAMWLSRIIILRAGLDHRAQKQSLGRLRPVQVRSPCSLSGGYGTQNIQDI
jgi:hypothetical protein